MHTIKTNESEQELRLHFEVARFIVVQMWNSAGKSLKTDIRDAKEAFPFPWEKEIEPKVQTIEEMKKQFEIIAAAFSNKPKTKRK